MLSMQSGRLGALQRTAVAGRRCGSHRTRLPKRFIAIAHAPPRRPLYPVLAVRASDVNTTSYNEVRRGFFACGLVLKCYEMLAWSRCAALAWVRRQAPQCGATATRPSCAHTLRSPLGAPFHRRCTTWAPPPSLTARTA